MVKGMDIRKSNKKMCSRRNCVSPNKAPKRWAGIKAVLLTVVKRWAYISNF